MADLTNLVGPLEVNVNGRYALTCKSVNSDERRNTAQHYGPYGSIGQSAGSGAAISGSMRVVIPKTGHEIDWKNQLAGGKSFLMFRGLGSSYKVRYEGVIFGGSSLSSENEQGRTEVTISWTAGTVV